MFETLDKMMLAGLGALSMSRERAEKIFDEYVQRGQVEKDSRSGFVKEVMDTADKTRNEMEKMIKKQVEQAVDKSELATREDIRRLEAKLESLEKACKSGK
jgi:poly(hydroxyalkanoate) granule-associated protein